MYMGGKKSYFGDSGLRCWGRESIGVKKAVGAAVLQDLSSSRRMFMRSAYILGSRLMPQMTTLGYDSPAMEFNMENFRRQDFCVMIWDIVLH